MNKGKKHIETLLERFWNGITTGEEEKELYRYFSNEEIPEDLEPYRSLFAWYEKKMPQELASVHMELPVIKTKRISWKIISGIAALLVIILGTSFYFLSQEPDLYEGSYIVRNGIRITDLNEIRSELQKTETDVLKQVEQIKNKAIPQHTRYNIEEKLKSQMQQLIEETPEGPQRNAVKEIINDFKNI